MITIEECKHIENLSKFSFSDEERAEFIKEFSAIVEFASTIQQANCDTNKKFINTMKMTELREDKVGASFSQEEVISNAPLKKKGCFVVPKIMD